MFGLSLSRYCKGWTQSGRDQECILAVQDLVDCIIWYDTLVFVGLVYSVLLYICIYVSGYVIIVADVQVYEILDNAVDEAQAGFADKIEVILLADGSVSVTDNGRGVVTLDSVLFFFQFQLLMLVFSHQLLIFNCRFLLTFILSQRNLPWRLS